MKGFVKWFIKDFFGGFKEAFAIFRRPKSLFNLLLVLFMVSYLLSYKFDLRDLTTVFGIAIIIVYIWKRYIVWRSDTLHEIRKDYKP